MIRFNLTRVIAMDMDEVLRPNGDTGVICNMRRCGTWDSAEIAGTGVYCSGTVGEFTGESGCQ